jgi:hypothetical protein
VGAVFQNGRAMSSASRAIQILTSRPEGMPPVTAGALTKKIKKFAKSVCWFQD